MDLRPYQIVDNQKKAIHKMKYNLQFSKNRAKDTELINTTIDTVNCLESSLYDNGKTTIIESLIYANIYELMLKNEIYKGKALPLEEIVSSLRMSLNKGYRKEQVISMLKTHEMSNVLKHKNISTYKFTDFSELLTKLINNIKLEIK